MLSSLKPLWLRKRFPLLFVQQRSANKQQSRRHFRQRLLEQLEPRLVMDSDWQNPARPLDVNNNGNTTALDALLLINKLNSDGPSRLPVRTNPLDYFYDPSGDGMITPRDVLLVINQLNQNNAGDDPRIPGETELGPAGFLSLPLTTLSGVAGQIVKLKADLTIGRVEFNEMGVFVVDDAAGHINGVAPSSTAYPKLAFEVAQRRVLFSRRDEFKLSTTVDLPAGQNLRVYVLQASNGDGDVTKHLRVSNLTGGAKRVGWEEFPATVISPIGDRGFDDAFVEMYFEAPLNTNSAPILASLPDRSLPELTTVTFNVTAFDADLPADTIRYSLDNAPAGATINATNGAFAWTPTEAQGPGNFTVVVRATDSTGAFDTESIQIEVLEVNLAPALAPLADVDLRPGDAWQATVSASDPDLPANELIYSVATGAPAGFSIDSRTGVMRFTAPTTDRQTVYPITISVRDSGSPSLSASRTFNLRVTAQRTAPVIDPIANQTTPEMTEKVITVTARDLDLPDDTLRYTLVAGPSGATLDQTSGVLRWTPTEVQGPGSFPVTVRATDRDNRTDTKTFTITVSEVNRPPVLEPVGNFNLVPGQSVSFAARASDPDLPLNSLTYSISGNAPPGFSLNTTTGQFNWTASATSDPIQYDFTLRVTDNGSPSLSASQPIIINVALPVVELVESNRFVTQSSLPITIGPGIAQLQFTYDELTFDRQDTDSINDALEVALVDNTGRPLVGIITPNRDGFYNRTEELSTLFGAGATFTSDSDGNGGTVRVDVSHLPEGLQTNFIVRLVNNDSDDTTRVKFVPRVQQIAGPKNTLSQTTPPAWASTLDVVSRSYNDTDWRHLSDVTGALTTSYDYTAYDTDTQRMGAGVTLRNTGNYPIRGPLLITVSGITSSDAQLVNTAGQLPRDASRFSDPVVAGLAGSAFLDATQTLAHADIGSALLPGESVRLLLEFANSSQARFDYQIHVLGTINRAPEFNTQAPDSVRVGNTYRYDSGALDPDDDALVYTLVSGPSGLTVDPISGLVQWTPTASDVGTHRVSLRTVDPFGASDTQRFTINVLNTASLNRPPLFVTDPVVDATVGVTYQYSSRAADPDFDALTYSIVTGPAGMAIATGPSTSNVDDTAGNVTWAPPASAAGTYVSVTLKAIDGRGGEAIQNYRIYVRPSTVNLPPVIVTTPQIDFDWAGPLGTSTGLVTPQVIELDLEPGQSAEPTVTVQVPPQLPMVDIFLLLDDTGSFSGTGPKLSQAFPQLIDRLREDLPNVDLGFGVGRFEDYGGSAGYASGLDRPFVLNQSILPATLAGMRQAIVDALKRTAPGGGGDGPESLIEALYQLASGVGFDGNNNGSLLESGPAGMLGTQTTPGGSGDVPPFLPTNFDAFRADAVPLPLNTTLNIPAITNSSLFAFKFQVAVGETFRFVDTFTDMDAGQWLLVNQAGRIVGTHARGQTFVESFESSGEILLVPRAAIASPAATLRREVFQTPSTPLVFGQDNQFSFNADGDRQQFTFTLSQTTPVIFDALGADSVTTWTLTDGQGRVFSARMYEERLDEGTPIFVDPEAGNQTTADQIHVLTPGDYVLTVVGKASVTPTQFRADKFPPTATTTSVGNNVFVAGIGERLNWVRVDGQVGQGFTTTRLPTHVLDADGLPLPRSEVLSSSANPLGQLVFGEKPTLWLGFTSRVNENISFFLSQSQAPTALPSASAVTLGATVNGQLIDNTPRNFEITLDSWQWVTVAASQGSLDWRLRSMGGAQWSQQTNFVSGSVPFLNREVLLPPGRHRLAVSYKEVAINIRENYQFTVTARPLVNVHVAGGNPNDYVTQGPGTRGGAGFRPGAIPIILAATDIGTAYQSSGSFTPIVGVNGIEVPLSDFDQQSRVGTPGGRGATIQQAINALLGQGALVIGLGTNDKASDAPRRTLEAISKLTGATNAGQTTLQNNSSDPIAPGDPLYFYINNDANALSAGVAAAIKAAIQSTPSNIDLQATDDTAGFTNKTGIRTGIAPNTIVPFNTQFVGDGQAHVFDLQFVRTGTTDVIGTIPVAINDRYRYDSRAIDPENDPVTLELMGNTHGAVLDEATGKIRWRPTAPGSYTFTLRARDTFGGEDVQTWTVNVGDLRTSNAAPRLSPLAPVVVDANTPLRLQAQASDTDAGDQLRYYFLGAAAGGLDVPAGLTIDNSTGQINWTPTLSQVGQTRVIVRVTDAHGGSDDEALVIEVVPPAASDNHLPNISTSPLRSAVVARDYRYDVDAEDIDHDPLTYTLVSGPRGLVIDSLTGVVAWNPQLSDLGVHDVLLKVNDGRGGVVFQSYQLLVSQTNDSPEIVSRPTGAAAPGSVWNYTVVATDPNGDVLRYSLLSGPAGAAINANTGRLSWTPTITGAYSFLIEVSDGRGGRARQEFTLPVSDSAPPTIVSKPTGPARVGERYEYVVVAFDPNAADPVTISLDAVSLARGATITSTGCPADQTGCAGAARLVWTPDTIGEFPFTLTATDTHGNTATQSFTLPVVQPAAASAPPLITSRPAGPALKDKPWSYLVIATDPDGDAITYRLGQAPAGMSIDSVSGVVRWTPSAIHSGVRVEVVAEDARGAWSMQSFDLPVVERLSNAAPIFTSIPTGPATVGEPWRYAAAAFDPDGDTVVYSLDADALAAGVSIDSSSGQVSYTPRTSGTQLLTVFAKDTYGGQASQTITLPIQAPLNLPPNFLSIPTGPAYVGRAWTYAARANDPEGDVLRYSLGAGAPANISIDTLTGRITFTASSAGQAEFTVIATDTASNQAVQQFTLPIVQPPTDSSNRPPVFSSSPVGPARVGIEWIYQALAIDADGDVITYALDSASLAAGLSIEASTGRVKWTARTVATQTIEISARDTAGNVATQRFDLQAVSDNRAPVIESEPKGPVHVGRAWTYVVVATDPDGDTLTLSLDEVSRSRGVTITGNLIRWTPAMTGDATLIVTASDGHGGQATQTIQLNVTVPPVTSGNAPRFRSLPPKETALGSLLNYQADAFDPDGTEVRYALTRGAVGMSINAETGVLSWRPEQLGTASIEITAIDASGEQAVQTFTLNVVAGSVGNQPPIITSSPRGPAVRNLPYQYPVEARDPNGDALTFTLDALSLARGMTISSAGLIDWQPTKADDYPVQVTVRDALGATAQQSFTLTVLSNAPPRISSVPPTRVELGQTLSYTVLATDPNPGDNIVYSVEGLIGATIHAQSGALSWQPSIAGRTSFTVVATDNHGARDEQVVDLLVVDPANNQAPTITGSPRSSLQFGSEYLWQVPATDADGDSLTFTLVSGPSGLTVDARGVLRWTPEAAQVTTGDNLHSITVRVSDGRGGSDSKTWRMAVTHSAGNQAPTIRSVQVRAVDYDLSGSVPTVIQLAVAGRPYQALFSAVDPEGDTLVWSLVDAPTGMRIDSRGLVDYRPTTSDIGTKNVQVRVTDAAGASGLFTYKLTVRGGNSPAKIAGNPPVEHKLNALYSTTFMATDVDNDVIAFRFVPGQASHGAILDASTGKLTWTPTTLGTYRFFVAAVDPLGEGTQLVFDVLVSQFGPNDPPRFEDTQPGIVEVGVRYSKRFPAIDPDGDALTYAIEEGPAGMAIASDGTVTWDATAGLVGTSPLVKLTAKDPAGHTARYDFRLPVRAANNAPRFDSTPLITVTAGNIYRTDVVVSDVDGDPLTLKLLTGPSGLSLDAATGRISWNTVAANVGTHNVKVSLTDGRIAQPLEQSWTITVAADAVKPQIKLIASTTVIDIGSEVAFEVRASDNVAVVERTLKVGNTNIALSISGFGKHTFIAAGRFAVAATASDAAGNISTDELSILVRDPNNAAPQLLLVSPTAGQALTAPTDVVVSVTDAERDLTSVRLLFAPADGSAEFRQFASRIAAAGQKLDNFSNQTIGKFDPTNLANGAYIIRAIAEDAGFNQTVHETTVQVSGRLKLGNFTASFDDLTIPVSGMPITIVRSYDTLDVNHSGDFGNGWKLDIKQARVRIDPSTLGGVGSGRYQAFVNGTRVIVKTPDGTEEGFTFRAIADQTLFGNVLSWKSNFDPDRGNNYKLEAPAGDLKLLGDEFLSGYGTTYNPQDAEFGNVFQVTSIASRITYNVNATTGETGSIQDRNENKLTLRDDGIISSTGRSVTFQRDMLGRIVSITDPRGNSLRYGYDAEGDLVSFTDRMGNTVRMTYLAEPAHYLSTVIDPLGNVALKASYKLDTQDGDGGSSGGEGGSIASGRLAKLEDGTGSYTAFEHNAQELRQTQRDEKGIVSTVQYDGQGNPLEVTERGGTRIIRTFDDPVRGLPAIETQVVGQLDSSSAEHDDVTVRRTYNQWGQITSETDNRGNVTRYLYNNEGVPTSTINPDGSSTYYSYDDKFNLTYTSSSTGGATSMTYDKAGQVTEVRTGDFSASGNVVKLKYNRYGEVIETQDPDQNKRSISFDANGNNVGTEFQWIDPNDANNKVTLKTSSVVAPNDQPQSNTSTSGTSRVEFDTLNRPFRSIDENGLVSETLYDLRGLAIETRSQSLNANGAAVWIVSRTVYDENGRAIVSTDSLPEGTAIADIGGAQSLYDDAGRVLRTERRLGIDIQITGAPGKLSSKLNAAGRLITSSETAYDANGRPWQTIDNYGRKSQTLFDRFGQAIESRSQSFDENGVLVWLTSRTVYDSLGRVLLSTDRYVVPGTTELGAGASPAFFATTTVYDSQGRSIGSQRISGAVVTITGSAGNLTSAITTRGSQLHESKTIYDTRGRVSRTISSTSQITDTLYDARDRQIAIIGHPLPAEQVGLGSRYPGKMVRLRSETEFNSYGQVAIQRTNVIQVEESDGRLVTIDRRDARETQMRYDAEGRLVNTIAPDGTNVRSEYDSQGRVVAEINQLGLRRAFEYDASGRLTAVVLPEVTDPATGRAMRPRYEYGYNAQGSQTLLRDPLGRETRFEFDSLGRQVSRTLPLGFGLDGIQGTSDDAAAVSGAWTERMTYDERGRAETQVSFEGVVTRFVYDDTVVGGGRLSQQRFYPSVSAYQTAPTSPAETWSFGYDAFGREVSVTVTGVQPRRVTSHYDDLGQLVLMNTPEGAIEYQYDAYSRKTATRIGKTIANGQPLSSFTAERATEYAYDSLSRLTKVTEVVYVPGGQQRDEHRYFYDLLGSLDAELASNGLYQDYVYDNMQRLRQLTDYRTDSTLADTADLSDDPRIVRFDYTLGSDGRRTAANELWYEVESATQSSPLQASYQFTYDNLGRLTDEVFDHWDNSLDYRDRFAYDPAGNRVEKSRDAGRDGSVDARTAYRFDVNDRLLDELAYAGGSELESRTTYTYDHSQNTGYRSERFVTGSQTIRPTLTHVFIYDLQGRLSTATVTNYSEAGVASSITRSAYDYDRTGIRVSALNEIDSNSDGTFESRTKVEYLVDHSNHTGYQQVIRETHFDIATNKPGRLVDYTFGHDEISQTVVTYTPTGTEVSRDKQTFLHDGKANVRGLLDAASAILTIAGVEQIYLYDAYGSLLNMQASQAATTLLYNGEIFDALTGNQYLRARYYNPANAQFNRLDPFFGNQQDPQSFNKYGYVHGDPIGSKDPLGLMTIGSTLGGIGIGNSMRGTSAGAITGAGAYANTALRIYDAATTAVAAFQGYLTGGPLGAIAAIVGLDPSELSTMTKAFLDKGITPATLVSSLTSGTASAAGALPAFYFDIDVPRRGKLGRVFRQVSKMLGKSNDAQEFFGEIGAGLLMHVLGFHSADLPVFPTVKGPDFMLRQGKSSVWAMVEAKGGTSRLSKGADYGDQMQWDWIRYWYHWLAFKNQGYGAYVSAADGKDLWDHWGQKRFARDSGSAKPIVAAVVSLDLNRPKDHLKIGIQAWTNNEVQWDKWKGF